MHKMLLPIDLDKYIDSFRVEAASVGHNVEALSNTTPEESFRFQY